MMATRNGHQMTIRIMAVVVVLVVLNLLLVVTLLWNRLHRSR